MRADSARLRGVELALERSAGFQALSDDAGEIWLWENHDLASLLENRLNLQKDPVAITDADRDTLGPRVTSNRLRFRATEPRNERAFWILDGSRRRVGTIALADPHPSDAFLELSSLYVVPRARRRGSATRALTALHATALKCGFSGTRLATEWSWQTAVRFYLRQSMWVWSWKHALELVLHRDLPSFRVDVAADRALFIAGSAIALEPLIEARHGDDRLSWRAAEHADSRIHALAPGTFALALAARGWPLVTDRAAFGSRKAQSAADRGGPDDLALQIRSFEARDRERGWHVATPRIPGLE